MGSVCPAQNVDDRVEHLYEKARAHERDGHVDQAIQDYQEILRLKPRSAVVHNNLGRLYYQQTKLPEAVKSLRLACEIDPQLEPPRALLGFVLFQMGDYETASKELGTALSLNPKDTNVKLFLARSLFALKRYDDALRILQQLQHDQPKNTEVLFTLGNVYSSLAETTIAQIQEVDPNSYLIEVLLGSYDEVRQVYRDAAEHYKRAIDRAPDLPDLYYRYAHALWMSGDPQNSLTQYKLAVTLNPYDYRALWEKARAVAPEDPEEAIRLATRALDLKPNLVEALTVRGKALLAITKPKEAAEDFKHAVSLDSEDPAIHFQLARAYRQLGMTQEAQNENAIYERLDRESHAEKERQGKAAVEYPKE